MSRTITVPGVPKRLFQYLVAGFAVLFGLLFGGQAFQLLLETAGVPVVFPDGLAGVGLFAIPWLALTLLWVRLAGRGDGDSSFWSPIPAAQYNGRFAEAGGIARHNWEQAVRQLPDGDEKSD